MRMKLSIRPWLVLLLTFVALQCVGQNKQNQNNSKNSNMQTTQTFHDFTVKDIDGKEFDLASLKGKKVLVVNVASKCGLTPQYEDLQALYDKYKDRNFTVIGFPANNFAGQEPGTNAQIKEFCTLNYGVTFPMMDKISVKGKDQAPVYNWLTHKSENGKIDQEVTWNFQKFMIDEEGNLVDVVQPKESPMSEKIIKWITGG
jgi:glutathione peroxidase